MADLALEALNVSKTFGERKALDGVSVTLRPGEMTALIGPSGSGKSTLMRVCAGLIEADATSGAVRVQGALVQERGVLAKDVREARRKVVAQQGDLPVYVVEPRLGRPLGRAEQQFADLVDGLRIRSAIGGGLAGQLFVTHTPFPSETNP